MYNLDKKDKLILNLLQKDCRQSTRELSKKLKIPATTIHQRIKKLVERGIVKSFSAILDTAKIGLPTTAFIFIKWAPSFIREKAGLKFENIGDMLAKLPEVQEVYVVSGDWDVVLKLKGANEREIGIFVVNTLWNKPEIERTLTFFSFKESKDTHAIELR
jgi:DNA-binding Lrp family transcriptional regulator